MKLMILGGSGFVSGHLAKIAIEQGHEVWCVTRGHGALPDKVHSLIADRNDEKTLAKALQDAGAYWDACLDCICFDAAQAQIDCRVLTKLCGRLIVLSTDSVYHPAHKLVPQDENGAAYMEDGGYGAKKREMELIFLKNRGQCVPWTIFRPGHIYGAGSKLGCFPEHSRQDSLKEAILAGKPLRLVGGGSYLIHPIYVGDLCRVMLDSIEMDSMQNEIYCIGGPEIITNAEYYRILGRKLGCSVSIEAIPEAGYLDAHPEFSGHLCNRAYDLTKLRQTGIHMPDTTLQDGLPV